MSLTKAEARAAEFQALGFIASPGGMLGHGTRGWVYGRISYYVHLVRWWRSPEKSFWNEGTGIWLCGNMSAHASLVTEIPDKMAMCPACTKKANR